MCGEEFPHRRRININNPIDRKDGVRMSDGKVTGIARRLYEGKECPHYSCGICLAVTFGCNPNSYKSLRKGGITGKGECGALKAGEMILGEYLGDPDPTGPITEELQTAVAEYRKAVHEKIAPAGGAYSSCSSLTGEFTDFTGEARKAFCAEIVTATVEILAGILAEYGVKYELPA
jgi:hypothetical protein